MMHPTYSAANMLPKATLRGADPEMMMRFPYLRPWFTRGPALFMPTYFDHKGSPLTTSWLALQSWIIQLYGSSFTWSTSTLQRQTLLFPPSDYEIPQLQLYLDIFRRSHASRHIGRIYFGWPEGGISTPMSSGCVQQLILSIIAQRTHRITIVITQLLSVHLENFIVIDQIYTLI
jgi:hypothetical protein